MPQPKHFHYVTRTDAIEQHAPTDVAIRFTCSEAGTATPSDIQHQINVEKNVNLAMQNYYLISSPLFHVDNNNTNKSSLEAEKKHLFCNLFNQLSWPSADLTVAHKSLGMRELTPRIDQVLEHLFLIQPQNKKIKWSP